MSESQLEMLFVDLDVLNCIPVEGFKGDASKKTDRTNNLCSYLRLSHSLITIPVGVGNSVGLDVNEL